jgi:tRNA U38,U39,U40 pseudouridine synthase TruA
VKLTIESTNELTRIDGVNARVWKGRTDGGVECICFVHRIAVHNSKDQSQFERELKEQLPPGRFVELRQVL